MVFCGLYHAFSPQTVRHYFWSIYIFVTGNMRTVFEGLQSLTDSQGQTGSFIADNVAVLSATEAAIKKPVSKIKNLLKIQLKIEMYFQVVSLFYSVFFCDVVPAIVKPLLKTSILRVWNASKCRLAECLDTT